MNNSTDTTHKRFDFELFSKEYKIVSPCSDRFLEIDVCKECSGQGKIENKRKRTCKLCEGKGWFEDSKGLIMVCDMCHGFKKLYESSVTDCRSCESKGKKVYLMQKFLVEVPCEECMGTGERYKKCPECDGKGHSFRKLSVANWNSTDEGKKMTSVYGPNYLLELEEGETWLLDDRRELKIKKCHECTRSGKINCYLCNGKRIIFVLISDSYPCEICAGKGRLFMKYDDFSFHARCEYESVSKFNDEDIVWDEENVDYEEEEENKNESDSSDYCYEEDNSDDADDEKNNLKCELCKGKSTNINMISLSV